MQQVVTKEEHPKQPTEIIGLSLEFSCKASRCPLGLSRGGKREYNKYIQLLQTVMVMAHLLKVSSTNVTSS
jgi:hypothetical protein